MSEKIKVVKEDGAKLAKHADLYRKPKAVKVETFSHRTSMGDTKEKFIRSKTFSNGVVKNEVCGLKKNGKWIFGTDK